MTRPSERPRSSGGAVAAGAVRFGRYVLIDRLGQGGMAEVFRALVLGPEEFQRVVVVKRILPSLCANPAFIKMFIDEARVCGRLSHPNVIQVFEFGRQQQHHFIAMEYLHGRNLNHMLARLAEHRQTMPVTIAAEIMRQACRGLAYAHGLCGPDGRSMGIVHRDVSPGNVIVAYSGEVKILDFGVARVESRFRLGTTDPGHVKGKASYLAPEQVTGQGVDHRADIFAAGILLYEMLTTRPLFKSRSAYDSIDLVRSMPIPAPSASNPEVPAALDAIVARALHRDPAQRYQHAGQMADALEAFLVESRFASQELPAYMRRLFPDESVTPQLSLDTDQLSALASDVGADGSDGLFVMADLDVPPPGTPLGDHVPRPGRRRLLLGLAAAGVAGAAAVVLGGRRTGPPAAPVAPASSPRPTGAASATPEPIGPAPAVPSTVKISITSDPPGASVRRDSDRSLGNTPLEITLPRSTQAVVFRVSKSGYLEGQLTLVPDCDRPAVVSLARSTRRRIAKPPTTENVRNAVPIDPFAQ